MARSMLEDDAARPGSRLAGADAREGWEARRERALEVLRRAEDRVGVRAPGPRGLSPARTGVAEQVDRVDRSERAERVDQVPTWGAGPADGWVPVPAPFAPVVAGLPRGGAVRIEGSTSLLLAFAAAATTGPGRGEGWIAVVGMPDLCLAAAAGAGLDLDRVVVVPDPGERGAGVAAAAVDGFETVLLGPAVGLRERELRSLLHRVRHRSGVLLTSEPCPGAALTVRVTGRSWQGVERGFGLLSGQEIRVRLTGRGVDRSMQVRLDGDGLTGLEGPAEMPASLARVG
ncbi:hypothetical protein GCG21_07585 [Pseudactinotalea sp. HY160]|uniref:hypothetical protein n=1 Tax=Pseudactinotalea sp. HY160 TaxID=2654490 RepID=UPI00128B7595|nr:hypothetical protein [Pseudactinotalea sp. HY160]MPV49866.1 hypothetical protein [Pseudactinotalea sp. HY160]